MDVSHSKTSLARGCWKKYYWKYVEKLEPIKQSSALTIGKIIHEAFEMFYKGSTDESCIKHIAQSFDSEISRSELADHEDLTVSKWTALGMWSFYPHKSLSDFEAIDPEVEFRVRIGRTRDHLVGRIDGRVMKNGVRWCREVKTTGLGQKQFEGRMRTSAQATSYVYALDKIGTPAAGVMFDVIRKAYLRKRNTETAEDFGKRIFDDYRWRGDQYYFRHYEYRTPVEIALWERDMVDFCKDLRKRHRSNQWYRNVDQCWNFNSECPYLKICFSETPDPLTLQLMYKEDNRGQVTVEGTNGSDPEAVGGD